MRVTDYLRLLKNPDKGDLRSFAQIEKMTAKWISSDTVATEFLTAILEVFHDAFDTSPVTFMKNIFFPNQLTLRATYARQDFALSQFKKAKRTVKLETRQIALENVYRSIVADLFDPYLSILVACVELKQGNFQSFEISNLEKAEINKYQFLSKHLKNKQLLKGYFSIIRNAVSHAGSHSIEREKNQIIFKSVKRGSQPFINETKTVTTEGLAGYIQDLLDLIVAIEAAVNIMGLDTKDIILQTPEIAREYQTLLTQKQLAERRRKKDKDYGRVWNDEQLSPGAKRAYFIRLFAQGCQKNEMPASSIQFKDEFVIIQIPRKPLVGPEAKFLVNRVAELINYLLLAEMFFHFHFSDFLVEESREPNQPTLQLWLKAEHLKSYNTGESHILDLIHDGKLFRDEQHQPIIVDFDKLDENEAQSLQFNRKRKKR